MKLKPQDVQVTKLKLQVTYEAIDSKKAEDILNKNTCNRALREGIVEKYASDMKHGLWTECAMPIVFYIDGDVADGQHRLYAIIESKTTQSFLVVRNFPREAGLNIDTNLVRSLVDNAHISGIDTSLSNTLVSVARAIEDGDSIALARHRGLSNSENLALVDKHREAADWVVRYGPRGRGLRNAVILSALCRAWYAEKDKDRLALYSTVLSKGFANGPSDSAAVAMRNYLVMKMQQGVSLTISANWRDTFLKVQNSIHYFMHGKPLKTIKVVSDEAYPLHGTTVKPKHAPVTNRGVAAKKSVEYKARVAKNAA